MGLFIVCFLHYDVAFQTVPKGISAIQCRFVTLTYTLFSKLSQDRALHQQMLVKTKNQSTYIVRNEFPIATKRSIFVARFCNKLRNMAHPVLSKALYSIAQ